MTAPAHRAAIRQVVAEEKARQLFRKGSHVLVTAGRWKGRKALVVGRTENDCISLSLLDQDWDSPIVATPPCNLTEV